MPSLSTEQVNAILACVRRETTYDEVAERFGVAPDVVLEWESTFIQGGSSALTTNGASAAGTDGNIQAVRDRLSQINALNAISQSLSAILNLDELVDTTLDNLHWVFGYTPCVALVDDEDLVIKGGYGLNGQKINWYDWRVPKNTAHSIMGWVAVHGRPLNIPDTEHDKRYVFQEVVGPVRSELAIPMIFKGNVLGVLDVRSSDIHAFDQNDMSVLETVAFQLAVALENARLFEAVRRRVAQAELIQSITSKALENIDVPSILNFAVEITHSIMGYSGVSIGIVTEDQQTLVLTSIGSDAQGKPIIDYTALPIDDLTVIGAATRSGQIVLANEVSRDERFEMNPLRETSQSELVVPMRSKDNLIGVINVESDRPGAFDDTDVATLTLLADQLTIAIRGAELLDVIQLANARFQAVLEATDDGIIVWDDDWHILFANPAASRLLNIPIEMLAGASRDQADLPPQLLQVANVRDDERIEFPCDSRCIGRCRNLLWQSDRANGFLSVIHDITSQIVLEETREEMTSMLIHDLRGPLTSVVGGIELAQATIGEDNDTAKALTFLGMAYRGGNLLLNMANSLLDIAKFESGTIELERSPLQVQTIFDDVVSVLTNTAKTAGINLNVNIEENLPAISADNSMMRRAIQNLVDNALKFTPDGGDVTLTARQDGELSVRFDIADTGPGVPEAFRKRIFEKYGQVPGQKGRRRGTGLGLAFCKMVAEAHQGRLWVEPRPGGGSLFSLTITEASSS